MKRRSNIVAGFLAAAALVFSTALATAESLSERYAALYEKAAAEGSVVFYTSDSQGLVKALSEYWKRKFPKVELSILRKQSPDIAADIEAQRAAAQVRVDVFDFALPYVAVAWKEKGYLEPYKPLGFDALKPEDRDPDGAFIVKSLLLLSAAYNSDAIKDRDQLPKRLSDLLDPKWKDKMLVAHPASAANTKTFFMAMLQANRIDWTFMEKLAKQNIMFMRTNGDAGRMLAAGERTLSPMLTSHNVFAAMDLGRSVDFFVFEDGAVVAEEVSGILKGAPHPNAARLLMEVLASAEGQEVLLKPEYMWPTHPDAKPGPRLPKLSEINTIRVDLKLLTDKQASDAFMARFDKTFGRN